MNEICPTIYFIIDEFIEHVYASEFDIFLLTEKEASYMPINDKWYISLN